MWTQCVASASHKDPKLGFDAIRGAFDCKATSFMGRNTQRPGYLAVHIDWAIGSLVPNASSYMTRVHLGERQFEKTSPSILSSITFKIFACWPVFWAPPTLDLTNKRYLSCPQDTFKWYKHHLEKVEGRSYHLPGHLTQTLNSYDGRPPALEPHLLQ